MSRDAVILVGLTIAIAALVFYRVGATIDRARKRRIHDRLSRIAVLPRRSQMKPFDVAPLAVRDDPPVVPFSVEDWSSILRKPK